MSCPNTITPTKIIQDTLTQNECCQQDKYSAVNKNRNKEPIQKPTPTLTDMNKVLKIFTPGWKAIWDEDDQFCFFVNSDMTEVEHFIPIPGRAAASPTTSSDRIVNMCDNTNDDDSEDEKDIQRII